MHSVLQAGRAASPSCWGPAVGRPASSSAHEHGRCSAGCRLRWQQQLHQQRHIATSASWADDSASGFHPLSRSPTLQQQPAAQAPPLSATPQAAASLPRVLMVGQQEPATAPRSFSPQGLPGAGPVVLLLLLLGILLAFLAAVRHALVRRVQSCLACCGYGIVRCRLCDGMGSVDWKAKFSYSDVCPLCITKRYVTCPDCGGYHHRPLFVHTRPVNPKLRTNDPLSMPGRPSPYVE